MNEQESLTPQLQNNRSKVWSVIFELIKMGGLALITIMVIRYFLFKPFYVKGESMEPNFHDHEYLIIDELSYRLREPFRGDVIVFHYPNDPKEFFLKRIIALPGERVKVADGKVTVYNDAHPEGVEIKEVYLPEDLETMGDQAVTLGSDEYFVMGDNRPNSFDSRRFGPIHKSLIVGRALFRGWPFDRIEKFSPPPFNI